MQFTMQLGLEYYLVRPGTRDGRPGSIVPLIAVDQLPDWMQLADVPRELRPDQTEGLTNLGIIDREEDAIYRVRLHHDKIRAILTGTDTGTSSGQEGRTQETNNKPSYTPQTGDTFKIRSSDHDTKVLVDLSPPPGPDVTAQEQVPPSSLGKQDDNSEPNTSSHSSFTPVHGMPLANVQRQQPVQPAGPMLSASRHNVVDNNKPIRPHMTQAMYDEQLQRTAVTRSSSSRDITGSSGTVSCRKWCHYGTCKWGLNCRYQHRMPTTTEGLREVGLKDFPAWYLVMLGEARALSSMALGPSLSFEDLSGPASVGRKSHHHDYHHSGTTIDMIVFPAPQQQQQQQQQLAWLSRRSDLPVATRATRVMALF